MTLTCRPATEHDEPAVREIVRLLRGDPAGFDIARVIVACEDKKIIGCVRIKILDDGCLELASLAVLPEYQGLGTGSRLVREIMASEKHRPLFLLTTADREQFYSRLGWEVVDEEKLPASLQREFRRASGLHGVAVLGMRMRVVSDLSALCDL